MKIDTKWKRKKINGISPEITQENHYSIFTLNFNISDPKRKFYVIWLITNFISAIWCSRLEPSDNIIGKVLAETENLPKKTQLYLNRGSNGWVSLELAPVFNQ